MVDRWRHRLARHEFLPLATNPHLAAAEPGCAVDESICRDGSFDGVLVLERNRHNTSMDRHRADISRSSSGIFEGWEGNQMRITIT